MKGLAKFKKLLCFLIVSIFVFGFGGEIAKADVIGTRGTLYGSTYKDLYPTYFQWLYDTNNNNDVYCLNSRYNPPTGMEWPIMPGLIPQEKKDAVIAILRASETLDLSDRDRYYVTQAAIWKVLEGSNSIFGDVRGSSEAYSKFGTNETFESAWSTLSDAINEGSSYVNNEEAKIIVNTSTGKLTEDESHQYFVSSEFTLNGTAISGNLNVSIDSSYGNATNACILYNNNCSTSVSVPVGSKIKIRTDIPSNLAVGETVETGFEISATSDRIYDLTTYGNLNQSNFQNVVMLTSRTNDLSKKVNVSGIVEEESTYVSIQKLDADTGKKVAGAVLAILDANGNTIGEFESTGVGEENPKVMLSEGEYKLKEISEPDSYYYNDEQIAFSVVKEGTNVVVKQNGNTVSDATISISNKPVKIKFRKLDGNGNPVAGVRFNIVSWGLESISPEARAEKGYTSYQLCAISDADGYLTQSCPGDSDTGNVKSSGEYTLGVDFGQPTDIYIINEHCDTDQCNAFYPTEHYEFFAVNGTSIMPHDSELVTSNSAGSNPVITMNIYNLYYINISKTDITKSKEIPGAKITVTDPSAQTNEQIGNNGIVDSWVSGDEPHTIIGIVPNHRYRLTEETSPKGFVRMVNSIDFEMDVNGKVTTYDIGTDNEITDLNGTDYHLLVTNAPTKTIFSKTSAVSGEEIEGAHLKVCTKESYDAAKAATGDGNNCESFVIPYSGEKVEWVSETGKSHIVSALPADDYYLVETIAPEGYAKQTNSAFFVVKTDGSISKVELKNEPTKVVISKKDITTEGEIEGAQLKICTLDDYNNDSANCKPARDDLSWISGKEPKEFDLLPIGDYVLIETLPAPDYQEGMIIDGDLMSAYVFSITDDNFNIKIDVYNQVLTHVPSTGISTLNLFAIGGLMIFAGYETIKIYRRKALN